jgi:DNA-directed RNA polymerase specialized sigma24 family protein
MGGTEESVSLTEALRAGAPEAFGVLYDAHAEQLYGYCHIMVGEEAADTVRDAFIAVARHRSTAPADDAGLPAWLHALAHVECVRRGVLVRKVTATPSSDPLRRALARLRPEHREALALSLALETPDIARVIGVASDTAEMLVRVSRRRLEQAAASVLGAVHDEAMLAALGEGNLHKLVTRGYSPPPRQRERVLFSCAAAERAADGALLFDQDGMPIPLDGLSGTAEEVTHPFARVSAGDLAVGPDGSAVRGAEGPGSEAPTGPLRQVDPLPVDALPVDALPVDAPPRRRVRVAHAGPKNESFLSRKRDGIVEVSGLAACVVAATSVLAFWPSPHGNGASNMDGTSLLLHRGTPVSSRSAQPVPSGGGVETPLQAATSKPGASPSPKPTRSDAAPTTPPPGTTSPAQPASPPVGGPSSATPTPDEASPTTTPTPTPTPTPSDSPTAGNSGTPTPEPSTS